ncbi:MAG: MotA/TolQ/ExbB proton channel family protein [Spirochaetes bacterium]|nr:MotA/TolQ/ExbB proton channel family protein [Spirochaetota bacterium]
MNFLTDNIIVRGGVMMVPIILGSIIVLTIAIERGVKFWNMKLDVKKFSERIFDIVKRGELSYALEICKDTVHPIGKIFTTGIKNRDLDREEIERLMERTGDIEIASLEKNMNYLMITVGVEPMLGFLGTIVGLIQAFMVWEQYSTSITVDKLAAGIYQAMITTAGGLIVAIPFYIIYHIYLNIINRTVRELNDYGEELIRLITDKEKAGDYIS